MSPRSSGSRTKQIGNIVLLPTCFILVSCLVNFQNLKIEAKLTSETSVDFELTT
jgi:hypothetical protein